HGADVAVIVAYGLILPKPILEAFPLGAFNLHASLLPRWRGAAPINRAIMAGAAATRGIVMKKEEGRQTGPVPGGERARRGGGAGWPSASASGGPRRRASYTIASPASAPILWCARLRRSSAAPSRSRRSRRAG